MKKTITLLCAFLILVSFKHQGFHVGEIVDDFQLKNVDNKLVSMADFEQAKGFIVVFTCNHCPFSKKYEDRIIALDKKYKKVGYAVIAINPNDASTYPDDNFENMQKRAKEKKFTFPYLYDETQSVARTWGPSRTPEVFVVQKEGNEFILKYTGAIDDNSDDVKAVKERYVENALDALLAGKPVENTFTKAVGCGIKWKK